MLDKNTPIVPILAGGGTRLPAHVGILTALQELEIQFNHLVGVSGGSIVSSLYATGRSLTDIKDLALNIDFQQFKGQSLVSLIRAGGLSSGDDFEQWLDDKLSGIRFCDLPLDLHIVATDVASSHPVIFNKTNTPELPVSRAVRFSISIPLIFSFQHFNEHVLVDGSILSEDALHRDWAGDGTPVLCFRMRSEPQSQSDINSLMPIKEYMSMLIRTFMTTLSREYVNDAFWHSTIIVDTQHYSPVEFRLTREDKEALFEMGYLTTMEIVPQKTRPDTH
ncbi:patatin-like phospholipase family protein [Aestuariirhabdus sp. Z084]|uniref:patatin-like phospholipase family protein n=1 Tax=Aestuariirhabdus haliotis TaxID=2918751 RepID=UPI00201B38F8|nr:patatin-like phospholipase family protein [Aestuariirhabdus haliotis]MCL6417275.1 patatin-like phospholipase family protein [Aestuariirhabdus haliotis]MCL6421225.1 patatin-like phospholipase family protein [Aestuariirhabdus haliotis]